MVDFLNHIEHIVHIEKFKNYVLYVLYVVNKERVGSKPKMVNQALVFPKAASQAIMPPVRFRTLVKPLACSMP